jgi:hypothetical protein
MLYCISKIGVICGLSAAFLVFFWFLISLAFYLKINITKMQIYFLKFNTCTLIINYISKSCSSLLKKDFKVAKFCLRYTPFFFFFCKIKFLLNLKKPHIAERWGLIIDVIGRGGGDHSSMTVKRKLASLTSNVSAM